MSKLYQKYKLLKSQNPSTLYLFKSGIFYIFIDEDAKTMSSLLNLKLTNLNEHILKCGFPVQNLSKYLNIIKTTTSYDVKISNSANDKIYNPKEIILNTDIKNFLIELSNINIESLSIKDAYSLIEKINNESKKLTKGIEND